MISQSRLQAFGKRNFGANAQHPTKYKAKLTHQNPSAGLPEWWQLHDLHATSPVCTPFARTHFHTRPARGTIFAVKIIIFDTETTGFVSPSLPLADQPHVCQFAALTLEVDMTARKIREHGRLDRLIRPGVAIPPEATRVHGITDAHVADAPPFADSAEEILELFRQADVAVGHNLDFDRQVLEVELLRLQRNKNFLPDQRFDTMKICTDICRLPGKNGFKFPRLDETYRHFFGEDFDNAHNALADVIATAKIFRELLRRGVVRPEERAQKSLF